MTDVEVEPIFASVCSRIYLENDGQIVDALRDVVSAGENHLFVNKIVDINEDDPKGSKVEFSSERLKEPQDRQWNYVVADLYSDRDISHIHLHSYFDIDIIDQIGNFYMEISEENEEVRISSVEADIFVNTDVSEMGFEYEGSGKVSLDGVKFTHNAMEFSLYSVEEGSMLRGGFTEKKDEIAGGEYKSFVSEKLDQMEGGIRRITA